MTPDRAALVQAFGFLAWSELRRGHTVCVHAEDCAVMSEKPGCLSRTTGAADECTCHPYRIRPGDPRPMATILAAVEQAHRWH